MLGDIYGLENIYIVCGYTDMRKSINGLIAIISDQLQMDPSSNSLYLFCGRRRDRIKALFHEPDGFFHQYKSNAENSFSSIHGYVYQLLPVNFLYKSVSFELMHVPGKLLLS